MKKIYKLRRIIYNIIDELDDSQCFALYEGEGGHIGVVGEIERLLYGKGGILDATHSGQLEEWLTEEANDRLEGLNRSGLKKIGQWWWTYPCKEDDYTITLHIGGGMCIVINDKKITIYRLGF